ncbi:MAG: VWA domain-containing protein [Vicinamibacteria bacterium]|nr:VWA domain-containing protein [Vicinamibacteria bacterium]
MKTSPRARAAGTAAVLAVLAAAGVGPVRAMQQTPTFSAEIDVAALDVNVVDKDGRPIRDLKPEEFQVTVDGKPRNVVSAQFVDLGGTPDPEASPTPAIAHYSSNENAVAGRMVLFVVDESSIRPGGTRMVADAAGRLLNKLGPQDRSALLTLPGRGSQQVDFTPDHAKVLAALKKTQGRAALSARRRVSLGEALAMDDKDMIVTEDVLNRECPPEMDPNQRALCINDVEGEAFRTSQLYREGSRQSLKALAALFDYLRGIEGPKTLIFISEGLVNESTRELRELAVKASAARVSFSAFSLDDSGFADASLRDAPQGVTGDIQMKGLGLDTLASLARGSVYKITAAGDRVWDRLARELTGYWLLGFEPQPSDRDGKEHDFRVKVVRPGAEVRARRAVSIPEADPEGKRDRETLLAILRAPFPATELPIRVATYALRDEATGKPKVVVSAEIGRAGSAPEALSVGFVLIDSAGKIAANVIQRAEAGARSPVPYLGSATVEPGLYTLKLAVLDRRGRRGSVNHPVKASLHSIGGVELADLMLAPPLTQAEQRLRPGVDLTVSGGVLAYTEYHGKTDKVEVRFEAAESENGPALLTVPARATQGATPAQFAAQAVLPTGLLPPGAYVARAVVVVDGKAQGQLVRPFTLRPRQPGEPPAPGGGISRAGLAPSLARFDRREVLDPAVIGPLLTPLEARPEMQRSAVLRKALDQVRAGQAQVVLDTLSEGAEDSLSLSILRGVGFLARGDTPAATTQLKGAVRHGSDFAATPLLIGACYAHRGEDLQAAGAFQTAMALGLESPTIAALTGEALLRGDQPERALELLTELAAKYPTEARLQRSLGIAQALGGQDEKSLATLTGYLDQNPTDLGASFVVMRLLFERYAQGKATDPLAGDRERLTRYAKAYVDGRGPQQELVAQWLKYLDKTK